MAAVVKKTGILPDTIRAWERRYALVTPLREPSGLRAYSDADVARLELARDATRLGHAIRHVAALDNAELAGLIAAAASKGAASEASSLETVIERAIDATRVYDFQGAQRTLAAASLALSSDEFALHVVAPLLRRIGDDWADGKLDIAQEHAISQIVRSLAGGLIMQGSTGEGRDTVVFATPPGELHEFGIVIGAILASGRGLSARLLGPSLPAIDVAQATKKLKARAVIVASMAPPGDKAVPAYMHQLRRAIGPRVELWLGGPNAASLAREKSHVAAITTLDELAAKLDALRYARAIR
jgi:DNA-binding transcriptional MerR regulator